ncbi:MAG: DUF4034 domain-containing protein [Gammaproteobacteria bacterium]|nr:DUF4034 domain-containing protein [Gammaproteobacteria bacterium]
MKLVFVLLLFFSSHAGAFGIDKSLEILNMLEQEKFQELDEAYRFYAEEYKKNQNEEENVSRFIAVFDRHLLWMEPKLRSWIDAMPDSYVPYLLYGIHNSALGWESRGTEFIDKTTNKQVDKMTYHHNVAKKYLKKSLRLEKSQVHANSYLMYLAMANNSRTEINLYFDKALKINPNSFVAHSFYSFSLLPRWGGSLEELAGFVEYIKTISSNNPELKPFEGRLLIEVGDQYFLNGQVDKAMEYYTKAEAFGDYWYLYYQMGMAYKKTKQYMKSIEYFNKSLDKLPTYEDVYFRKANAEMMSNLFRDAIESIGIALRLNGPNARYYSVRAQCYARINKPDLAMKDVEESLLLNPDNKHVQDFKVFLENRLKSWIKFNKKG